MSTFNMDKLFNPKSIAVIGASRKPGRVGERVVQNIQNFNFSGTIWPVNPKYENIRGIPCSKSIFDLGDNIDLAIIATPIQTVPMILRACVQKKIHSALIVSDCRRIKGQDRKNIESEIAGIAYQGHMRLVGPNSLGLINQAAGLNVSYAATMPEPGKMAFVSQSGSIFTATLDMAFKEHFGFSYFINVGAMLDIDFGDLVDYLGNDPSVDSILLYIEELKNIRKFMSAARAVSLIKPIVVLRPGMHGKNRWSKKDFQSASYDAAFKRAGIISVGSIDELFDCAELMAKQTRPRGRNLVVINNGNAPGSKEIDVMAEYNMDHYSLNDKTISRLDKVLPSYWSRKNPINLLSGAGVQDYVETVKVCLSDKSVNGILLTMAPQAGAAPSKVAAGLVDAVSDARIPVMASWYGGRDMDQGIELFNEAGIPTFRTPEKAIRAFSHLLDYQRNRERIIDIPAKLNQRLDFQQGAAQEIMARHRGKEFSRLTIPEVRDLLEAYGIPFVPTRLAHDPEEAVAVANAMGYPVAMKLFSGSMHDPGGDRAELDLGSPDKVKEAFLRVTGGGKGSGVCIQSHVVGPDYKFQLGIKKDPLFGPVLIYGMGGILSEVLDEISLGLPPLNRLLARQLMEKIRAFHLLQGYRNRPPVNLEQLEELLIRLAQLAVDFPEILFLDINPLIIKNKEAMVLDAQVSLVATPVESPRHLVISPYPRDQERKVKTKDGTSLFLRPIRPEDTPLLVTFRETLSDLSLYYRFFRNISEFTPEQLHRLTTIDYDREIALIALAGKNKQEKMLGVVRIIADHQNEEKGDFYVIVSDECQSLGMGSLLLTTALDIARLKGIKTITGQVLPENEGMKKLARKIGFHMEFDIDERVFELTLKLN